MTRTKFEIMTEDIDRQGIINIVSNYFSAFSVTPQVGVWKRQEEKSLIITVIGNPSDESAILDIAMIIKRENKQEAVLIAVSQISEVMI